MELYTVIVGAVKQEIALLSSAMSSRRILGLTGKPAYKGELFGIPVLVAACGVGSVNTAQVITACMERFVVERVIMVGSAGAYKESGLRVGDAVVADEEVYGDLGVLTSEKCKDFQETGLALLPEGLGESTGCFILDFSHARGWLETVRRIQDGKGRARMGRLVTVGMVSGDDVTASDRYERYAALAENMEGAAGAHVCRLYGVPFQEIRGISNMAGDRDKSRWQLDRAAHVTQEAVLRACKDRIW